MPKKERVLTVLSIVSLRAGRRLGHRREKKGDALNKIRVIKVKIMKVTFLSRESVT